MRLRLVAGKKVQPVNVDLIPSWKTVDERLQRCSLAHCRWRALRRSLPVGPQCAGLQHHRVQGRADELGGRVRGEELPDGKSNKGRVQAYDGPIYIADAALYLKRTSRSLASRPYELNAGNTTRRSSSFRRSGRWSAATGTTPWCRWTTSRTKASSRRRPGRSRSTC